MPGVEPGTTAGSAVSTNAILSAMLRTSSKVSDLIFSPGRPPQVELSGELVPVKIAAVPHLSAEDTRRIAGDLIGNNKVAMAKLREQRACDVPYSLPWQASLRANVFMQRAICP